MTIDTLTIENFKSIKNLRIEFGGNNATISGQNGSGKTSILDAVCWLLTNKMADGKTGESGNFHDNDKITVVEMKLDSGLVIRRECNGKSVYFVHGVPYNATDFKACVNEIFKNAVPALLTPFNFCRLHYSERRNILLHLFANNIKIDTAEFADIAEDLKKLTPAQIIKRETQNLKQLEKELVTIPARISEIQSNISTVDTESLQTEIAALEIEISANADKIKSFQAAPKTESADIMKLESGLEGLRARYATAENELAALRKRYEELSRATTGTCPTCGSKVPAANLKKIQAQLSEIALKGKELAEKQELLKKAAAVSKNKIAELRAQADTFNSDPADENALQAALVERDELQEKLSQLKFELAEVKRNAQLQKRIEQLKAREIKLGADKTLSDKKIFLAETYIRRKIELTEQTINQQFQFVTFKMFDSFKVAEGVKECCEPYLNGVPYVALSKGEQLKVSLDILKALQRAFGIELPVFIDDSESYTSNSFVDLPNQIIKLVAAEGVQKLQIDLEKVYERKSA